MKNFLKWALIIVLINIVIGFVTQLIIGDDPRAWNTSQVASILNIVSMLASIACLFLAIRSKKSEDPSDFTFGKGWIEGFLVSIMSGLLVGIWMYFVFSVLAPEAIDVMREDAFAEMANQGMPQAEIEQARPMMEFMMSPTGFFLSIFLMWTIGGMVLSLLFSAIVNAMGGKSTGEPAIEA